MCTVDAELLCLISVQTYFISGCLQTWNVLICFCGSLFDCQALVFFNSSAATSGQQQHHKRDLYISFAVQVYSCHTNLPLTNVIMFLYFICLFWKQGSNKCKCIEPRSIGFSLYFPLNDKLRFTWSKLSLISFLVDMAYCFFYLSLILAFCSFNRLVTSPQNLRQRDMQLFQFLCLFSLKICSTPKLAWLWLWN